jgi:hypothetical protein
MDELDERDETDERDWLAQQFEANWSHLGTVAHCMLGSLAEAEDTAQESWLHQRATTASVSSTCSSPESGRLPLAPSCHRADPRISRARRPVLPMHALLGIILRFVRGRGSQRPQRPSAGNGVNAACPSACPSLGALALKRRRGQPGINAAACFPRPSGDRLPQTVTWLGQGGVRFRISKCSRLCRSARPPSRVRCTAAARSEVLIGVWCQLQSYWP